MVIAHGKMKLDVKDVRHLKAICFMENAPLPNVQSQRILNIVVFVLIYHAKFCRQPLITPNMGTKVKDYQIFKHGQKAKKHI